MATEYVGAIKLFGGTFAIVDYAFCNGALMAISQNNALFALIGTTYGGDGVTTFGLPDLQGRVPIGVGTGLGLSPYVIGERAGVETVTLLQAQIPAHTHSLNATTNSTTSSTAGTGVLTGKLKAAPATDGEFYAAPGQSGFATVNMNPAAVGANTGGNQPHNNIQPTLGINYLISLFGIFPTQN